MVAKPKPLYCALLMDEMAIRQKVEYDGRQYRGYIDVGTGLDDDSLPVAKEALTFMIVAFNDNFKLPVGYFLVDGLGAVERANVVNQCISKLFSVGGQCVFFDIRWRCIELGNGDKTWLLF